MKDVKKELKKKSKGKVPTKTEMKLTKDEQRIIQSIDKVTNKLNENNVTRTAAYLDFYQKHSEIHWALLGHMVSRNGGWNMTDLKGELLTKLLSEDDQNVFFSFLERGNWLIFQDIYPQFLLYEQSLDNNENLFYLLPYLKASTFMETMWNFFWESRDPYPLAIALIINEQCYLEKRVIQNSLYKKAVLDTVGFKLYDFLHFNNILFPYYKSPNSDDILLKGETSTHFNLLHERIMLGKRLYTILFDNRKVLSEATRWANDHPHTGSRKDFWPHLFNDIQEASPRHLYKRRIKDCNIINGANRLYSPPLKYAWENVNHKEAEEGDWYHDWKVLHYITDKKVTTEGDIYNEYCLTLESIELAILAKSTLPWEEEETL